MTNNFQFFFQQIQDPERSRGTIFNFQIRKSGITLLLVILVLASIMMISFGIFNIILTELQVSGELSRSFRALYTSDQGLEYMLYRDRVLLDTCLSGPSGDFSTPCQPSYITALPSGDCATSPDAPYVVIDVYKFAGLTKIRSIGRSDCRDSFKTVARAFQVIY